MGRGFLIEMGGHEMGMRMRRGRGKNYRDGRKMHDGSKYDTQEERNW